MKPPFETFKKPTCRGSMALGTACGKCEKCKWEKEQIVGHKTLTDGSHVPLYKDEAESIWAECEERRRKREEDMPTEQDALEVMFEAYQRLKELGWNNAIYCPKDGTMFDAIEAGSTGIHDCSYRGE